VQDLGRPGHGALGVSASGAADAVALRLGNHLVGNWETAAGLEMTLLGATLLFETDAVVAVTGAPWPVAIDGVPQFGWRRIEVAAGQTLTVGSGASGARAYLAIAGGIEVPEVLGSASTHLLSGLGGLAGRALRKGDLLCVGGDGPAFVAAAADAAVGTPTRGGESARAVAPTLLAQLQPRKILRVVSGVDRGEFPTAAWATFVGSPYRVGLQSNRTGLRLEGPALVLAAPREFLTEGAPLGAVQVPPGGQPILLFVEHQTTGGYPKIANVIAADIPSVGQLRPHDEVRFAEVSLAEARAALVVQEGLLRSLSSSAP
jgi:antagonist of KipI